MFAHHLTKLYHWSHRLIHQMPLAWQVALASRGRSYIMQHLSAAKFDFSYIPPQALATNLWGIPFSSRLGNAAGMFKNGEAYTWAANLGAGAYLGGTSTANPRRGNQKDGISLPFISLPASQAAINWLGLPNLGDSVLANRLANVHKQPGCPLGWSVMRSPDFSEEEGLSQLLASLWLYHDNLQVDFIEINESCPNICAGGGSIVPRLNWLAEHFLALRRRHLPVVVKLSNDLTPTALLPLLETIVRLGFDGINLGNTAVSYAELLAAITPAEQEIFNYFTTTFGGGVSGLPLKQRSLELCAAASEYLLKLKPTQEFHVIRCGGIFNAADIVASTQCGVSFNQWYTGFFDNWRQSGNQVYSQLWQALTALDN